MAKEERNEHISRTRQENCRKVALDFMRRNVGSLVGKAGNSICRHYPGNSIHSIYLDGYEEGFSMAVELILSGDMEITEVIKSNQGSEPAR